MLYLLYIQLCRKICICIYIVLERESVIRDGEWITEHSNDPCVSCLGWRWDGGGTVLMTRCSRAQRSVASVWGKRCKQVVSGVRGVCDDVTCPILPSGEGQVLKAGQVHTNDPFCCPYSPLLSYIWFAGWPKPDSYRAAKNRLNNSGVKLCHTRRWKVELFQLTKEAQSQLSRCERPTSGTQEPEWLHCSYSAVHDGEWGENRGVSPEVHDHLHSFEHVELQIVVTAPDSQLLLVSVLDEADQCGVICKLQELDRGVFRGAVIRVEGEEQWGENAALRSSSADRIVLDVSFPSLTSCCLSVRKLVIHWQMEVNTESWISLFWRVQTGFLHESLVYPDVGGCSAKPCWLHHPQTFLLCKKTEWGPARVQ